MTDWMDPKNWYWLSGTIGWCVFIVVCLRALFITRDW